MTASTLLLALAVTALLGGTATAWLWLVQRPRAEREEGLRLLAAMRWREFSKLVTDGLRSHGFEPEATEDAAERSQDAVIHLRREGEPWLLACKQGVNYHVTPTVIGDIADAVRFHGAAGGVVATPGSADAEARRLATGRVDIYEGETLWPLVRAQLSHGVQSEVADKARQAARRQVAIAWAAAGALGLVVVLAMPKPAAPDPESTPATARVASPVPAPDGKVAGASPTDAAVAAAPISEDEQRDDVIRLVSTLPGVERAMWSTRSTLLVYLADENADPVRGICDIMHMHETLRTSRLHLQPPAGASRPARFLQCTTF